MTPNAKARLSDTLPTVEIFRAVLGSLRDVQVLAGHTNLRTTQRYIEANPEAQNRVVQQMWTKIITVVASGAGRRGGCRCPRNRRPRGFPGNGEAARSGERAGGCFRAVETPLGMGFG